jgi:PadR family transcriptional regulator, regulatory protein PadR
MVKDQGQTRNELLPGTLEMLVLKTLTRGPMHGYGIAQYVGQISDEVLQVEEGSLYPALQRLLLKGWVTAEWKQTPNNRRARYYRLTPLGRKQLVVEAANYDRIIEAIARVMQSA